MHKTSNKPSKLQRIRPLTVEDAAALKKRLGKGSYTVTAVYTDGANERVINLFNVGTTQIPDEFLVRCQQCGENPVDYRIDRGIWCRDCNEQFMREVELISGEEWPL